ncbi:MAG TPA: ribonuclease HII, partial [Deltaproteobacteria bacterium]|nr:ribonuclease HII [Deltaproteobacteria bacterium]
MRTLGLDEAGRGCVLGPMVVGAYCVDSIALPDELLRAAGATDSKKLSAKRRAKAWAQLSDLGEHVQVEISAVQIDAGNLNQLEEAVFVDLIDRFEPEHVYIDAPTHPAGIPNFTRRLVTALRLRGTPIPAFTIEPKADLTYPVVGAASIGAKLLRDARIEALGPVGSGYPSDPVTRAWLA